MQLFLSVQKHTTCTNLCSSHFSGHRFFTSTVFTFGRAELVRTVFFVYDN